MHKNKRVLIVADSMAMPRVGVAYEDTWIRKLTDAFPEYEFIDKSRRASTTERLVTEGGGGSNPKGADILEHYIPDIVIMQIGIVDCAPRYVKKGSFEYIMLHRIMPMGIRMRYIAFVKKNRTRDPRKAYVLPNRFRSNLANYFQRARAINTKVIVILIASVSGHFVDKSPNIIKNITIYNDIYRNLSKEFENVDSVQPFDNTIDLEDITTDGYHTNSKGHDIIFQKLINQLCPK